MFLRMQAAQNPYVALRKESVDRNPGVGGSGPGGLVALRKESVDRNAAATLTPTAIIRRSPQGERG